MTNAIVITEGGEVVELEDEQHAAIVPHTTPAPTQPVRVVEVIAHDYIWNEQHRGFFPVFGAMHAGAPIMVAQTDDEARMTQRARARHAAAAVEQTKPKSLLRKLLSK